MHSNLCGLAAGQASRGSLIPTTAARAIATVLRLVSEQSIGAKADSATRRTPPASLGCAQRTGPAEAALESCRRTALTHGLLATQWTSAQAARTTRWVLEPPGCDLSECVAWGNLGSISGHPQHLAANGVVRSAMQQALRLSRRWCHCLSSKFGLHSTTCRSLN